MCATAAGAYVLWKGRCNVVRRFLMALALAGAVTAAQGQWTLPQPGTAAPDFTLYNYSTGDSATLSDYLGKTVVLIFGSFT